jgi:hypothetical protein
MHVGLITPTVLSELQKFLGGLHEQVRCLSELCHVTHKYFGQLEVLASVKDAAAKINNNWAEFHSLCPDVDSRKPSFYRKQWGTVAAIARTCEASATCV